MHLIKVFFNFIKAASIGHKLAKSKKLNGVWSGLDLVTQKDLLADFLRGIRLSTNSFIRHSDKNYLEGKEGKTIRLRWLSKKGTPLDVVATDFMRQYDWMQNLDEIEIINDIIELVINYPAGISGYAIQRIADIKDEIERFEANAKASGMEADSDEFDVEKYLTPPPVDLLNPDEDYFVKKQSRKRKAKKIAPVKTATKKSRRKTQSRSFEPEYLLIRRLYSYNGKSISITQLQRFIKQVEHVIESGTKNHLSLLKTIRTRLQNAIAKYKLHNFTHIEQLALSDDIAKKAQRIILNPKLKVSLGNTDSHLCSEDELSGIEILDDKEMSLLGISQSESLGKITKTPYEIVNNILINALQSDNIPWINQRKNFTEPGQIGSFCNYESKRPYHGLNVLLVESFLMPHHSNYFLTKNQIEKRGGTIKKGAVRFELIFAKKLKFTEEKPATQTEPAKTEEKSVFMLRNYYVYNTADTDLKLKIKPLEVKTEKQVIETCELIYPNMPKHPPIKVGGSGAFYVPAMDYVNMPKQGNFINLQAYYRTLFHELVHSTGHERRLKRDMTGSKNSKAYRFEELVAEIGASYICAYTGIFFKNASKHASYIDHYLKEIHGTKLGQYRKTLLGDAREDKTLFFRAAGAAQKAANFILSKLLEQDRKKKHSKKNVNSGSSEKNKQTLKGIGNTGIEVTAAAMASVSPFVEMEKLVSGGTYTLNGDIGKFLGNLGQIDCSMTIKGDQGAGKSQLMWQLVNAFANAGKRVAVVSPEMSGNSPTISKYRDQYISKENQTKILFTDKKLTVEELKSFADLYDVLFVDSFNQLKNYKQEQLEWLSKELPQKTIVGLFQSTTAGEMRGGNKPEFDAYVNVEVVKVDDSFKNNYAVCTKNRFGGTGVKYDIFKQKIVK